MKRALVPLAEGFEEIEAVTVIDVLRRAAVTVDVAALGSTPVKGSHGISVSADIPLARAKADDYDMIVLPGGMPGTLNLRKSPELAKILKHMARSDRYIAAICAAPIVLATHGLVEGKEVTSHPSVRDQLEGVRYSEKPVVIDGKVVTSRGPGTALLFALILASLLVGGAKEQELEKLMVVQEAER